MKFKQKPTLIKSRMISISKTRSIPFYSIVFLLFFCACSSPKKEQEKEDISQTLMKDLEGFLYKGDTVQYKLQRKKIEETIHRDNNNKLELYFETHDGIKAINAGDLVLGKFLLTKTFKKAEKQNEYFTMFTTSSHLGNIEYYGGDILSALEYWKKAVAIAEKYGMTDYIAATYGNIAVGYLELGYYNNASHYFLKSKEFMDKSGIKDENYWTNHINIANVYLSMKLTHKAISFLKKTDTKSSKKVKYLYYANLASAYTTLNDQKQAVAYLDSTRMLLPHNELYKQEILEEELESYLHFNLRERLEKTINIYLSDTTDKEIPLKCVFNEAYFAIHKQYKDDVQTILSWEKSLGSTDYKKNEVYFSFVASVFENLGDYKSQSVYLKKYEQFQSKLIDEKLKNQFEDYLLSQKNKEILNANTILTLRSQTKEAQLKKQRVIFLLLASLLFLIIILIFLMYFNSKKTKILKEQELQLAHAKIAETHILTEELHEKLSLQNEKLENTLSLVNKINILKKQLDDFFDKADYEDLNTEVKNKLKSAKLDFKSFFSIYSDLTVQASSLDEFQNRMKRIPEKAPELTKKELQVAQLILNKYTTKEIALLLSRSVKNIEFTRSEIRKKLDIPNDIALSDYLQNI